MRLPDDSISPQNSLGDVRAQTSTVGVLFAVLLVLVSVTAVSVAALGTLDVEDERFTGVSVTVTTEAIEVQNAGGDVVSAADLTLVVRRPDGTTERRGVDVLAGPGPFEPGETARFDLSPPAAYGDLIGVQVVHEPSGRALYRDRRVAREVGGEVGGAEPGLGRPDLPAVSTASESPIPTVTPTPQPTPTPVPSTTSPPTQTTAPTPSPTASPTQTPAPTPDPGSSPTVEITDIGVQTAGKSDNVKRVTVTFRPDDPDGDLRTADVTVFVAGRNVAEEARIDVTGDEGERVTVTVDPGGGNRGLVAVTVEVRDERGETGRDAEGD